LAIPDAQCASSKDEHLAVVRAAGLFDTSHMAVVRVLGPGAFDLLQQCFARPARALARTAPITPGKCVWRVLDQHVRHRRQHRLLIADENTLSSSTPAWEGRSRRTWLVSRLGT
jgi:hypothetical protein